jgi:hypothetical protein
MARRSTTSSRTAAVGAQKRDLLGLEGYPKDHWRRWHVHLHTQEPVYTFGQVRSFTARTIPHPLRRRKEMGFLADQTCSAASGSQQACRRRPPARFDIADRPPKRLVFARRLHHLDALIHHAADRLLHSTSSQALYALLRPARPYPRPLLEFWLCQTAHCLGDVVKAGTFCENLLTFAPDRIQSSLSLI